jgi:hypothetical protein
MLAHLEIVQFAFIGFSARCACGEAADGPFTPPLIQKLMTAHLETIRCQRKWLPFLAIPEMMHDIASALLARGADSMEGFFRLPGNMKKVGEFRIAASECAASLADALGSLFKSWFGSLPEPIVRKGLVPELISAHEQHNFLPIVNQLPQLPQLMLKYLVDFLKR